MKMKDVALKKRIEREKTVAKRKQEQEDREAAAKAKLAAAIKAFYDYFHFFSKKYLAL